MIHLWKVGEGASHGIEVLAEPRAAESRSFYHKNPDFFFYKERLCQVGKADGA
jgi:hypothetical protein